MNEIEYPEDWTFESLKSINSKKFKGINPGNTPDEEFEYYSIPTYQKTKQPELTKGKKILSNKTILEKGTVLFGKLNPRVEKVWIVESDNEKTKIGSTEWIPIKPDETHCNPKYLFYACWSNHIMPKAKTLVTGSTPSRQRVQPSAFYELKIPLPPLPEQDKIAKVLTTIEISKDKTFNVIKSLYELRKSLTEYLFTYGPIQFEESSSVELQETEYGNIKNSWELKRIQDFIDEKIIVSPLDGNHGAIHPKKSDFVKKGIPFVMASNLNGGRVKISSCNFIAKKQADSLQKGFSLEGDILLSHKGTIGRTAIVQKIENPYIMLTPQVTYYRILDNTKLQNKFLYYFFQTNLFQDILNQWAGAGSTRAYLGITEQRRLPLIKVPLNEQKEISKMLKKLDEKIFSEENKLDSLNKLFNSSLENLLSAKIRVNEVNV